MIDDTFQQPDGFAEQLDTALNRLPAEVQAKARGDTVTWTTNQQGLDPSTPNAAGSTWNMRDDHQWWGIAVLWPFPLGERDYIVAHEMGHVVLNHDWRVETPADEVARMDQAAHDLACEWLGMPASRYGT
jgi:hypothetical protein